MGSVNKRREIRRKRERKRRIVEVSLLLLSVLFLGGMLSAVLRVETVDFPNPALKQAVRAKLGPGIITKTSVSKIRKMDMSNGGHEDLAGIESLWNMRRLNLAHNYVSDLTPLSGLQHLTELDLSYNNVYNLEGLQGLVNLEKLNLEGNIVRDLTPLKDLPKLRELNLNYNDITSLEDVNIDALAGSPLRILRLRDNYRIEEDGTIIHLNDVSGVQGLHDLWRLDLRFNQVQDIVPIAQLNSLGMLDLRENGLSDISDLAKIRTLRKLNLRGNEIKDISPLRDLKNLTYLNLHSNFEIASIEPIKGLVEMDTLIVCNIPIGEEFSHVSGMHKLRRINFRNCGVTNPQFLIDLMAKGTLQDGEKKKDRVEIDLQYNGLEYTDLAQYRQLRDYWDNVSLKAPFALPRPMNDLTVTLSHPSGFYEEEFDLVITCDDPNARILYTLDGSEPDVDNIGGGKPYYVNYYNPRSWKPSEMFGPPLRERRNETYEYMGPIRIKDRSSEPNDLSEIVTTYKGYPVSWLKPQQPVIKGEVVNVSVFDGETYTPTHGESYFVLKNEINLPVISITIDNKAFFGFNHGIGVPGKGYFEAGGTESKPLPNDIMTKVSNFGGKGKYWARKADIKFLDKNKTVEFKDSEMRVQGNWSRMNAHKGIKSFFTQEVEAYDDIFETETKGNISSLTFRSHGTSSNYVNSNVCYDVMKSMNLGVQNTKYAIQFINGEYWGVISIIERFDEKYFENNISSGSEHFVLIKEPYRQLHDIKQVQIGDKSELYSFNKLHDFIVKNDLSLDENFELVAQHIDLASFIDYNIAFLYLANTDWHGIRHFRIWKKSDATNINNKWSFIVWDFDNAIMKKRLSDDLFYAVLNESSVNQNFELENIINSDCKTDLFARLYNNQSFREMFITRALWHIDNTFQPQILSNIIDEHYISIESELERHYERWNYHAVDQKLVAGMKKFVMDRPEVFLKQLKKYFPEQF